MYLCIPQLLAQAILPPTIWAMWAIFCSCNDFIVPPGWQRFLRVGPVMVAKQVPAEARPAGEPEAPANPDAPAGEGPAPAAEHAPACACCYYTASVQLDPDKDPNLRTCGWFWDTHRESWVWWHGKAPHAPFEYPYQGPDEDPEPEPAGEAEAQGEEGWTLEAPAAEDAPAGEAE